MKPLSLRRSLKCNLSSTTTLHSHGFTLIELLLYIAIVSTLLITITGFFALSADSRIKNQTIAEVDQQGAIVMDTITQAVRNANGVTTPAVGGTGASLSLAMPTAGINPTIFDMSGGTSTVMGYNVDGGSTDTSDSNFINVTKFTATASGTISALYAYVGPILGASPNNKAQMAIYNGTASAPTTLLASSSDQVLTASSLNTFSIASVNITSGQIYWLGYNTNGTASTHNGLRYHAGATNQSVYTAQTYGTWPASWPGGTNASTENSMHTLISSGGGASGAAQIKEGVGSALPLTNSKVEVSGLTFKNLARAGTPGLVQISFTVSRKSDSAKNEFSYQKTFTSTAAVR